MSIEFTIAFGEAKKKTGQRRRRPLSKAGFSLIEVIIALGAIVVASLPILGLVTVGLNISLKAVDTTNNAQILQYMTGQAQQANFSGLDQLASINPVGFDDSGNVTSSSTPFYRACFGTPSNTALLGGGTTASLSTVSIYILSTRTSGGMSATSQQLMASNPSCQKYTIFVADNGL